jgi:hypothetical protein
LKKALAYYNAGVVAVNKKNRRIGSRVAMFFLVYTVYQKGKM